jgi:xanthine/CO dehydrogenase XdhC/CoxF family maturation factor
MKDLKAVVSAYSNLEKSGVNLALATVVKVRGSSYRSPGARMLIQEDGKWTGSISGGCLEGDALRKARQVMQSRVPMTVTYDTREESNQNLGIGLGCNGVIDVFIEPLDYDDPGNTVALFKSLIESPHPVALATVFKAFRIEGERILMTTDGRLIQSLSDPELTARIKKDLKEIFETHSSYTKEYHTSDGAVDIFIELIQPSISVIIFGAGFDARPVSQLANSLGWNVTVTDECIAHIAPLFFPTADKLSLCQRQWIERDFPITPYTACILMSHNYEYDRDVLKKLIYSDAPYIGILGPRKRYDRMVDEFSRDGIDISAFDSGRIHSPIGLDIGAETPDEIALAIIGEIQSKFSNRSGGFLKYRNLPIHHRDKDSDQVFKQLYIGPSGNAKTAS